MKTTRKLVTLLLALCMALACLPASANEVYEVGVIQLVQHVALDAATQGFEDALKEKLGDNVTVTVKNASGSPTEEHLVFSCINEPLLLFRNL